MVTAVNNAFDIHLGNAVKNIHKICENLKASSEKQSLTQRFQQIDQHFRDNKQQMTGKVLSEQKQVAFSENLPQLPAQQVSQLQTQYINMIAPVNTGIVLANKTDNSANLNDISQHVKATESNFAQMTSSLTTHMQNPNDTFAQQTYIASIDNYQNSVTKLQRTLPSANALQNQICQQSALVNNALSGRAVPGENIRPEAINQSALKLSQQLDKLPQLPPNNDVSKTTAPIGPYTIAAQNAIKHAKVPDAAKTQQLNNTIARLNKHGENLSKLNAPNVSIAKALSEEILHQLQSLNTLLPTVVCLSESVLKSAFISESIQSLTHSGNIPSSDLTALTSALKSSNNLTLQQLNTHLPAAMRSENLLPLSADVAEPLQQLSDRLQKALSNPSTLPSDVSLKAMQALKQKTEAVLNYNNQFYALDQDNAKNILSTVTVPILSATAQANIDARQYSPVTIDTLVPNTDQMLSQLKNSHHINAIYDQINGINQTLSQIQPPPDINAINTSVNDYVVQSDNIQRDTMAKNLHARSLTPTADTPGISALTELTIQASTHNVLAGTTAKALAASQAHPQNTMATCTGSQMMCSFGIGPGVYNTLRLTTLVNNKPAANISDNIPMVNITPFPGCSSPTNPLMNPFVYPWPCMPILTPFIPSNVTTMIQGAPINTMNNKAICNYAVGGIISFINPNQITTMTS